MKDGYIKVACATVPVAVADTTYNTEQIIARVKQADAAGVHLLVLPELCVTGYSCGDLLLSDTLLAAARDSASSIVAATRGCYPVVVFGLPLVCEGKLYNCAAVAHNGVLLGVVPKTNLPNYGEFYEKRYFASPSAHTPTSVTLCGTTVPFGSLVFRHESMDSYAFGVELCEDLWAPLTPSTALALAGATIIVNASASNETAGKAAHRRALVKATSARLHCGYVYADAAPTESTQDDVYSGHLLIAQKGALLAESLPFADTSLLGSEIDTAHLAYDRRRVNSFADAATAQGCPSVRFSQELRQTTLTFPINKTPFLPKTDAAARAESILNIQAHGLAKRLSHAHAKTAVIGISGGLDSTLALLATVRAMALLQRPNTDILAVTMPCFGTTARTKSNAVQLCELLGVTLREVNISAAVTQHFADIGQDPSRPDATYENAQARERTQVLMDLANMTGGLVVGTGDLSELALGWATYNGDHMSMYGVNASIPKTLVRVLVREEATRLGGTLSSVLQDVLDTPVSPELLPVDQTGNTTQKTEDLVGPYELHDFFLHAFFNCFTGKACHKAKCF